ncbi:MAG: NADH-quinone oxidoreductase subunit C [Candidatus Altiarchaeia archaeon]
MENLINLVLQATRARVLESDITKGRNGELYVHLEEKDFETVIYFLSEQGFELAGLFCAEDFENHKGNTLFYAFEKKGSQWLLIFTMPLRMRRGFSIAKTYPSASWYEREITDGFGITFAESFDARRLFLHESYPEDFHPLVKSFKNQEIKTNENSQAAEGYQFKKVEGEGVYEIPVGPVHAGIIEPGHFRFSVIGETVYNLEIRMFYKHRGIEKLAEGKEPRDAIKIAESISGDETVANAAAYCTAIEKISGIEIPIRAAHLRTAYLELERIYSLLGDLAGMCVDVAFPVGASPFFVMRENILRHNKALTGSRFMKETISIGGLKKDAPKEAMDALLIYLDDLKDILKDATSDVHSSTSVIDRFHTTGIIRKELITPLHLTGPMARASGAHMDTRTDHPYGIYDRIKPIPKTSEAGDVLARFEIKTAEILDSARIIEETLKDLRNGHIQSEGEIKDGYAISLIESARGQSLHWVCIKNGTIDRYKIRTASFCNWQAIEHAVIGNIVPDFPLINKSLNLSYAGTDL